MPRNRIIVDFVTEDPLSPRQQQNIGKLVNDSVQAVCLDEVEGVDKTVDPMHHVHLHKSTEDEMCRVCVAFARDELE